MIAIKEAYRRVEEENGRLMDERLSLLVELGGTKDDFVGFREKSFIERSALEAEFDVRSDEIFNYVYACCAFEHDIRGSKPKILTGMSNSSTPLTPEFFMNPQCPLGSSLACPLLSLSRLLRKIWQTKASRVPKAKLTYYWSPRLCRSRLLRVSAKNHRLYFARQSILYFCI